MRGVSVASCTVVLRCATQYPAGSSFGAGLVLLYATLWSASLTEIFSIYIKINLLHAIIRLGILFGKERSIHIYTRTRGMHGPGKNKEYRRTTNHR